MSRDSNAKALQIIRDLANPKELTLLEQVQEVIPSCREYQLLWYLHAFPRGTADYAIAWLVKFPPESQKLDTIEHFQFLVNEYWADAPQGYLRMFQDWQGESVRGVVARITQDRLQWARIDHKTRSIPGRKAKGFNEEDRERNYPCDVEGISNGR
jgi:hypothetical protein